MCSCPRDAKAKYTKQVTQVIEMSCLTILEARSSRSRCWSGRFLQRTVRKNLLPASLLAPGSLQAIFAVAWLVETSPWISAFTSDVTLLACASVSVSQCSLAPVLILAGSSTCHHLTCYLTCLFTSGPSPLGGQLHGGSGFFPLSYSLLGPLCLGQTGTQWVLSKHW